MTATITRGKTCAELGYRDMGTAEIENELRAAEIELEMAIGRMHRATARVASATRALRELRESGEQQD